MMSRSEVERDHMWTDRDVGTWTQVETETDAGHREFNHRPSGSLTVLLTSTTSYHM